jgi:phospho-2-dehydro-3-deoxyheptonate aldolase
MVDCSHANSSKQHEKQIEVARDIGAQVAAGSRQVFGLMVESHLMPGAQKFTPGKDQVGRAGIRQEHHRRLHRLGRFAAGAGCAVGVGQVAPRA